MEPNWKNRKNNEGHMTQNEIYDIFYRELNTNWDLMHESYIKEYHLSYNLYFDLIYHILKGK